MLLVALGFSNSANAADSNGSVSWTYVEGGLATFKADNRSGQTGLFGGGSIGVANSIHILAELGSLDNITTVQLGAGWHGLFGPKADLFTDVSYYDVDYDDGLRVRLGARWMVVDNLELNGFIAWTDLDLSTNSSAAFNGIFNLTERVGLGGGIEWGNKFNTARVFARFNF